MSNGKSRQQRHEARRTQRRESNGRWMRISSAILAFLLVTALVLSLTIGFVGGGGGGSAPTHGG